MAILDLPIITLEEHWGSQQVAKFYADNATSDPNAKDGILGYVTEDLMEFGPKRLASMDSCGVSLQVVSHVAVAIPLDVETCRKVNDQMHAHVKDQPSGRFAGFATLPMAYPGNAAAELRRCVSELGFVGTLIDSNCGGTYYDDESYWPVFQAAEELDVPVYIHPAANEDLKNMLYAGNYPDSVAESLSQYGWGWHTETALHFLRLYAAGLFDRFPKLKIVLGHLGEMLPFQLDRIVRISAGQWPHLGVKLQRGLRQVWDENLWITMSGMFAMAPMACALRQIRPERLMFSVDYPYGSNEEGVKFLVRLRDEGMVSEDLLERIAYRNAEELLKIKVHGR